MKQRITGNKIYVSAPYTSEAPKAFRNAGGNWQSPYWVFDLEDQAIVDNVCKDIYMVTGREQTAKAEIEFVKDEYAWKGPVLKFGFCFATARGRDTGAKTGDGVKLKSGYIGSDGSVKNWKSHISAETVFVVNEFPVGIESTDEIKITYLEEAEPLNKFSDISDEELIEEIKKRGIKIN